MGHVPSWFILPRSFSCAGYEAQSFRVRWTEMSFSSLSRTCLRRQYLTGGTEICKSFREEASTARLISTMVMALTARARRGNHTFVDGTTQVIESPIAETCWPWALCRGVAAETVIIHKMTY